MCLFIYLFFMYLFIYNYLFIKTEGPFFSPQT